VGGGSYTLLAFEPPSLSRPPSHSVGMASRRITISDESYRALQAEGLVQGRGPGDVIDELIIKAISPKAREVLTTIGQPSATATKPKSDKAKLTKRQLAKNPEALAEIKRLWLSGERDQSKIGEAVGYPRSTVGGRIRVMLEAGELEEEGEESTGG